MCIILFKPEGINLPSKTILKNCFENNHHGAGFMFPQGNSVAITKGFMTFDIFWENLKMYDKKIGINNLDLVIHFRIATQGFINKGNCHPFPVSERIDDLKSKNITTPIGIAHNGSISFCEHKSKKTKSDLSDTQLFILRYLAKLPPEVLFHKTVAELIAEATNSKFVIMSPRRSLLIGDFIKDQGIYYSNYSYLEDYYDQYWFEFMGDRFI